MSDSVTDSSPSTDAVDAGSYEVVRRRLEGFGARMRLAAEGLNARRVAAFGATELAILGNERVRTEHNSVPRDVVQVGGALLLGCNVQLGLKQHTAVDDVLSLHTFEHTDGTYAFHPVTDPVRTAFLHDATFVRELEELFQYYKDARLLQLRLVGGKLLAVFQVGATARDVRVFRWAIDPGRGATYVDNRGERDHVFPPTHDFAWTPTTRADHVLGRHPHVNVLDTVFVETVGGDLTVKVENSTTTGQGIHAEPVDDPNQSLDDADIRWARRGPLILLRILPFRETVTRYLVFNTLTRTVTRIDGIGSSCVSLPEDHGLVFPGGYYLSTGEFKLFEAEHEGMELVRTVVAPNGEDVLYVFHRRDDGLYALYPYNLVAKAVSTPIHAHGWSLFDDGTLVVFRGQSEATRVHPVQIWRSPFVSDEHHQSAPQDGSLLGRIGNKELVRGVSDALSLARVIDRQTPSRAIYEDLVAACERFADAYPWAAHDDAGGLVALAGEIRGTAERVIDEFEKVQALQERARAVVDDAAKAQRALLGDTLADRITTIEGFLDGMTRLRAHRGHLITLRETRFVDTARLDALEQETVAAFDAVSQATVTFLLGGSALVPLVKRLDELLALVETIDKAHALVPLTERLDAIATGVNLLGEVVAGLEVEDPTDKTRMLDDLSEVVAHTNRTRAVLEQRRRGLRGAEGRAEFVAQVRLFDQGVASALALCDTPETTDAQLSRLLLQLEELDARFGEFDDFMAQLATKREEVYEAFAGRKQTLLDQRQQRIAAITGAATRVLDGVARRARTFRTEDELQSWFAADPMVLKLRQLAEQLTALGDTVKADELASRLVTARQEALRALRDQNDLFDDNDLVRLGKHRFTVNRQGLELTLVPHGDDGLALHLLGTDFREPVNDPVLETTRPYWSQTVVSENADVYRAEYLATTLLLDAEAGRNGVSLATLEQAALAEDTLLAVVRKQAGLRYDEGYDRGVHDVDATRLLAALYGLRATAGLLRFPSGARTLAALFRAYAADAPWPSWSARARSLVRLRDTFGASPALDALQAELGSAAGAWARAAGFDPDGTWGTADAELTGAYLAQVLAADPARLTMSSQAAGLRDGLLRWLEDHGGQSRFEDALRGLGERHAERFAVLTAWLGAVALADPEQADRAGAAREAAALMMVTSLVDVHVTEAAAAVTVTGLLGRHDRIVDGQLTVRLDETLGRISHFRAVTVPGFLAWRQTRTAWLAAARARLRIDELQPRVMSAFVRNQLVNDVYLPLVGDNLAKQLGAAGSTRRTDLMGLLLLVSPPGYGKTTLMEYVASRLGLTFVKVNGPALGHGVTSLDPAEAPNATSRQEVERINLAFELANNVMLYLDDIQHCHPELLQKFISLCDAQRRIEGVWQGRTRTYDMRGKKFCVVMAGNPYTEQGERFQIPDMLANRADTYNLGDVLDGQGDRFAMSFVENALTSNPVLAPLATRAQDDVYKLVKLARGEEVPSSELSHDYAAVEIADITAVLRHLMHCRDVVHTVNAAYVASAATEDAFRTEPRFQLQGSYRNMNKLAEKVVAAMTPHEVEALVSDHYRSEAQTLTTGAEANLLKLAQLRGVLTPEQTARWTEITTAFRRQQLMGGGADDPATRITGVLSTMSTSLDTLGARLADGRAVPDALDGVTARLDRLQETLASGGDTSASLTALTDMVRRVGSALAKDRTPPLTEALTRIGAQLERPPGVDVSPILHELRAMRAELAQLARAPAPSGQALPPGVPMPDDFLEITGDLAEKRRMLLDQVKRTLDPGAEGHPDEGAPATLAAALSVIEMVTLHMAAAARARLPAEQHEAFVYDLKRSVAAAVHALASEVRGPG